MNRPRLATWVGIIGPLFFILVFAVEGWLRPDYNSFAMFVSELSLGSRGWVQIANFLIFGISLLTFTRVVVIEFREGKASKAGPALFAAVAVCCLLSGIFVTDPSTIFAGQKSLHGILHGIFGAAIFLLMPITCFVFLRRFWNDPKWQSLKVWTLVAAVLITVAVIFLILGTKLSVTHSIFSQWLGFIQRASIIPYMVWISSFAGALHKKLTPATPTVTI